MHQLNRIAPTTKTEALDQYYTRKNTVQRCLSLLGDLSRYDLVIEPSAGSGAFLTAIGHDNVIGIDIDPQHSDVLRADWFDFQVPDKFRRVLVVGNPPYGQYHKLSTAFIRRALSFENVVTIAFILPNVYRKHTRQRIIPKDWRIKSITDLGQDCFTRDGKNCHIPTSFFVLDRSEGPDLRVVPPSNLTGTLDFDFGTAKDFDVFVFGASPKRVIENPRPNNRGYYLKAKIPVTTLIDRIKNVQWTGYSAASGGVYWLTKLEFVVQYRAYYEQP